MSGGEPAPLVDDHAVQSAGWAAYARLGLRTALGSWGTWPWRMVRFMVALPLGLLPASVMAMLLAAGRGLDPNAVFGPGGFEAALLGSTAESASQTLVALLLAAIAHVALKTAADVGVWSGIKRVLRPTRRAIGAEFGELVPGFLGLAMIDVGFVVGTLLFVTPAIRAAFAVGAQSQADAQVVFWFAILVGVLTTLLLGWMRYLVALSSAWMVWRPRFAAATLVAAFTAPWRRGSGLVRGGLAFAVGYATVVWSTALIVEQAVYLGHSVAPWRWFALVFVQMAMMQWHDALLAARVGHRLGDVELGGVVPGARLLAASSAGAERFDPPMVGVYVGAPAEAPNAVVSFAQVLAAAVSPSSAVGWVVNIPGSVTEVLGSRVLSEGVTEVRVRLVEPGDGVQR